MPVRRPDRAFWGGGRWGQLLRRTCAFGAAILLLNTALPALAVPYPLALAEADALRIDPRIRSAKNRLSEAEEEIRLARATNRPTIRGTSRGGYAQNRNQTQSSTSPLNYEGASWQIGFEATQNIWSFGRLDARVARADAQYKEAELGIRQAEIEVLVDVFGAYAEQLRHQLIVDEWRALEKRLQDLETQTRQRVEAGRINISELQRIRVRGFTARAERVNAEAQLRGSQASLAQLTGASHEELSYAGLNRILLILPANLASIHANAELYSVRIALAKSRIEIAKASLRLAKAELLPRLDGRISYNTGRTGDREINDTLLALQFNIPIYEGGSLRAGSRQAKHGLAAAREDLDVAREEALRTLEITWERLQGMNQAVIDFEQAVAATDEIRILVEERLEAGRASISERLEAEQLLAESKVQLLQQQLNIDLTLIDLLGEIGLLRRPDNEP